MQPTPMPTGNIAVIGAGIAGLACATALREAGCTVTVYDKSRGPAGRLSTKRGSDSLGSEWQCDQGAPWFTATDPALQAAAGQWLAAGCLALWQPVVSGTEAIQAPRHVGFPRMSALGRHLAQGHQLMLQTTISAMRRDSSGWALASAEHGWLPDHYDAVVLALPAPQAEPLLRPSAAPLADAVAQVSLSACWSLVLRFSEPSRRPADLIFPATDSLLRHAVRDSSKPGRSGPETWLLQATAEWSDAHVECDTPLVANALLGAFLTTDDPTPQAWHGHRWRYASTRTTPFRGPVWQTADAIGLCGDWLMPTSTVESAWLSGQALARQMLADWP